MAEQDAPLSDEELDYLGRTTGVPEADKYIPNLTLSKRLVRALVAEVRRLRSERNEYQFDSAVAVPELQAELARLRGLLEKYGDHKESECGLYSYHGKRIDGKRVCTCGWAEVERELASGEEG